MPPIAQKRARFALEKDYKVHCVPHRWDYDAAERSQMWVTKQEYQDIRDEVKRIASLMDRRLKYGRQKLTPLGECTRGLDCQTQEGAVAKKVACLDGICAVLMEQEHQQSVGDFCDESIRKRYIEMNCVHVEAAIKRAQKDADHENEGTTSQSSSPNVDSGKAGGRIVNTRRNRNRISRLLFGTPHRSNSYEKRRRPETFDSFGNK